MGDGRGRDEILPGVFVPEFEGELRGRQLGEGMDVCWKDIHGVCWITPTVVDLSSMIDCCLPQSWSVSEMCHGETLEHHGPTLPSKPSRHRGPNDLGDAKGGRPLLKINIFQVAESLAVVRWHDTTCRRASQPGTHHATDTGAVASEWMHPPHEAARRGCHR